MSLSIVVAMARNRVIGRAGGLPWHLPADLKHFRRITLGKPIIMGRKTHESIGRALPGRDNIIVSSRADYKVPGCRVVHSIAAAIALAVPAPEIMLIGGAGLYRQTLAQTRRLYLTLVHTEAIGDTEFPAFDRADWCAVTREDHVADAANPYDYSFIVLERKNSVTGDE